MIGEPAVDPLLVAGIDDAETGRGPRRNPPAARRGRPRLERGGDVRWVELKRAIAAGWDQGIEVEEPLHSAAEALGHAA